MASNGIRFTQAYSGNTVCSPSRVSLLSGRDGRLMNDNSNAVELGHKDITIAHVLKHANYDTTLIGKYSIGQQMGVTDPLAMGFDSWYGFYSILEGHRQYPQIVWRNGEKIRVEANEGGKKGKYARYYPEPIDKPNAVIAGMISALDDYVGQLIKELDKQGKLENTLIVFTSDNGPHDEGGADPVYLQATMPYQGQKRDLLDGGIHVPSIVHWPAKIKQPRVDQTPWYFADVLPTFADIAGVDLKLVPRVMTNGVSIKSVLQDTPTKIDDRTMYWEFVKFIGDPNSGIKGDVYQAARRDNWKAVRYTLTGEMQLYDIIKDPGETNNLADTHKEVAKGFYDMFEKHKD